MNQAGMLIVGPDWRRAILYYLRIYTDSALAGIALSVAIAGASVLLRTHGISGLVFYASFGSLLLGIAYLITSLTLEVFRKPPHDPLRILAREASRVGAEIISYAISVDGADRYPIVLAYHDGVVMANNPDRPYRSFNIRIILLVEFDFALSSGEYIARGSVAMRLRTPTSQGEFILPESDLQAWRALLGSISQSANVRDVADDA